MQLMTTLDTGNSLRVIRTNKVSVRGRDEEMMFIQCTSSFRDDSYLPGGSICGPEVLQDLRRHEIR